jgi:hypothetical protein
MVNGYGLGFMVFGYISYFVMADTCCNDFIQSPFLFSMASCPGVAGSIT